VEKVNGGLSEMRRRGGAVPKAARGFLIAQNVVQSSKSLVKRIRWAWASPKRRFPNRDNLLMPLNDDSQCGPIGQLGAKIHERLPGLVRH